MAIILIKKSAFLLPCIDKKVTITKKKKYQDITNSIIFLIIELRLNIIFIISIIIQFAKNSNYQYTKTIKTILQYLKDSKE